MLFGALRKRPLCGSGLEYSGDRYKCLGYLSIRRKCTFSATIPECIKGKWKIPEETDNSYLTGWFNSRKGKNLVHILPPHSKGFLENQGIMGWSRNSRTAFLNSLAVAIVGNIKNPMWNGRVNLRRLVENS